MGVQIADRGRNANGYLRVVQSFRPASLSALPVGSVVVQAPMDQQIYKDMSTVALCAASATAKLVLGCVSEEQAGATYGGYDGLGLTTAPAAANMLGSLKVDVTLAGYHGAVLIDQSSGAASISNGTGLVPSAATAGRAMGLAAPTYGSSLGQALMPAAGPFSTALSAAALAQGTQTLTIAGTPAAGTVMTVPFMVPYQETAYGVVQFLTLSITLTTAQAASVTTAAVALSAAINANVTLAKYYSASPSAGVVTVTAVSNQFKVCLAGGDINDGALYFITTAGIMSNSLVFGAVTITGGGTLVASGGAAGAGYPTGCTLFSGGTGYLGTLPCLLSGLY